MNKQFDPTNFEDVIRFMGKVNQAAYGVNPFCARCQGRGWYYINNGPDDVEKEECTHDFERMKLEDMQSDEIY